MAHRLGAAGPVEMEALSPRDANVQRVPAKADAAPAKARTAVQQLRALKDKDHPPPPPDEVVEPASYGRPAGAVYKIEKLLGKGGFAVCYAGRLRDTRQRFALKIVKCKMPPKMEQKFQTELQIHSKMRHRNIVHFFKAFSFGGCTYLVLELCPNGSLMDMVRRRRGLTEPEVRFYAVQIAGAIKYMHQKGIIHRDLKMGNIFLDGDMNAKIGDFGLAALIVTGRDMHTIRRTTLCGTPNYIAPEILEKGKGGHDHSVDIWSLGIIMFAMLTSRPPFQSSTTDEIYRKARERDYEWPRPPDDRPASAAAAAGPAASPATRGISPEAKDLVASMLQDPDDRPTPDDIVQHPFFVSGWVPAPADITPRLAQLPPDKPDFYPRVPATAPSDRAAAVAAHRFLCSECSVGPWAIGQIVHGHIWKDMASEEKAGLTPAIPLADNIIYRPFDEWRKEKRAVEVERRLRERERQLQLVAAQKPQPQPVQDHHDHHPHPDTAELSVRPRLLSSSSSSSVVRGNEPADADTGCSAASSAVPPLVQPPPPVHTTARFTAAAEATATTAGPTAATTGTSTAVRTASRAPTGLLRAPPQSFAAQQRAKNRPVLPAIQPPALAAAESAQARALPPPPAQLRKASSSSSSSSALAAPPAISTSTTDLLSSALPPPTTGPATRRRKAMADARLAASVPLVAPPAAADRQQTGSGSIFGPTETVRPLESTRPAVVLQRLQRLDRELERALHARTVAPISTQKPAVAAQALPPVVGKWVDYSNKYGLGYILTNGSVGCLVRTPLTPLTGPSPANSSSSSSSSFSSAAASAAPACPLTCVLVRDAESHLQRRADASYADRHQPTPMHAPVGFFQLHGEAGFVGAAVPPDLFRLRDPVTKLQPGRNVWDHRKRERIVVWRRFANYMTANGRDSPAAALPLPPPTSSGPPHPRSADVFGPDYLADLVIFYQAFGDVRCWVFANGHLQFNFPDHTKIALDPTGTWCHFWHLPADAAERLAASGALADAALDERTPLSQPLQTLLNFHLLVPAPPPALRRVPATNDLRRKIEFVHAAVRAWVAGAGLGNHPPPPATARLRWAGHRERAAVAPEARVWLTLGARGGDSRVQVPLSAV